MENQKHCSKAISCFVQDQDDIVGQIAYSLYQEDKQRELKRLLGENEKQIDSKIKTYIKNRTTKEEIKKYRDIAETKLSNVIKDYFEKRSQQIETNIYRDTKNWIKDFLKELGPKHPFWSGVLQSLLGAFFFAVFCIVVSLYSEHNEGKIAKLLFGIEKIEQTDAPTKCSADTSSVLLLQQQGK